MLTGPQNLSLARRNSRASWRPERRGLRVLAAGLAIAGIGLLPWMVYLAVTLPASTTAWHWPAAWVGLDAMEAAGLIATGCWLLRGDARYCLSAVATAALLLTDAWFDVTTAPPGSGQLTSLVMAACCEVPAAVICIVLAVRGLRRLSALAAGRPARGLADRELADRELACRELVGQGSR